MSFGQKIFFMCLLAFVFGTGFGEKASAATYYVNGSGSSYSGTQGTYGLGVDGVGVDGSIATPWATMQYAESRIAASGDTLYVAAATYNENDSSLHCLYLQKSASWIADGTVIVRPYSSTSYAAIFAGGSNTISATGFTFDATKVNGATNASYTLYLNTGSNNKTFTDCTFANAVTDLVYAPNSNSSIVFTGPTFTGAPSTAAIYAGNIGLTVNSINVTSFSSARIFYHTADTTPVTFNGGTITASLSGRAFQSDGDGAMTINGITAVIGTNGTEPGSFAYLNAAAKNGAFLVTNNNITYTLTAGAASTGHTINVSAGNHATTVTGNTITCSSTGQNQSAIRVTNQPTVNISNNIINYGGTGSLQPVQITSTGTTMAVVFDNNSVTSSQSAQQVVLIGSDVSTAGDNKIDGAEIIGNSIYAPLGSSCHDLEYGYNKNGAIKQNYIYGGGYGIVIKGNAENYTAGYAVENILKDQSIEQMRVKGVQNLPVYNNTFYVSSGRTITNGSLYITVNGDSANVPSTGTLAKNNIFYTQGGLNTVNCDTNSSTGLVLDYNLQYMATGISPIYAFVSATQYQGASAWTNWQAAGFDTHGVNADPKLTSSSDFHLTNTSSAIDTGTDLSLTSDSEGNPIYGLPDIGAYEYQPTHTMVASTDDPQIGEAIKVYGDGKFRNTVDDSDENTTDTAKLSIAPQSSQTTKWIDLNISTWDTTGNSHKQWTESSDNMGSTETLHTVGNLTPGKSYSFKIDDVLATTNITGSDCTAGICTADENGQITFTYTGGYSEHTFDITDNIAPVLAVSSPETGNTVSADDTITFTDSEETDPQCSLDNTNWSDCLSSVTSFSNLTGWNSINENDTFTLYLKDTDEAGNIGTAQVANLTKADESAPIRSDGSPSGELANGTTQTTLTLSTDENATCKYGTVSGQSYADIADTFTTTGETTHSQAISNLASGNTYSYYIRCQDGSGNVNDTDYLISFSVTDEESEDDDEEDNEERDINVHNVKATSTENSITVTWKTDHHSKSIVRYGTDKNLKQKEEDNKKEKSHKVILEKLLPNTKYYFRIKSKDGDGNEDSSRIHSILTTASASTEPAIASYSENIQPNVCSYFVKPNDSLWNIAKEVYGTPLAYPLIIEKNKDKYPQIGLYLNVGQELSFGCKGN